MSEVKDTRTFVYHTTEDAKIVSAEEAKELYKQGWGDSPAAAKGLVPNMPKEEVEPPVHDHDEEVLCEYHPAYDSYMPVKDPTENAITCRYDAARDIYEPVTSEGAEPETKSEDIDGPDSENVPTPEKPLSQMNVETLKVLAEAEGIIFAEGVTTKDQMRNAITTHRNER